MLPSYKINEHKKSKRHPGIPVITSKPRPLSMRSLRNQKRNVNEIVNTYNRPAAEGGEEEGMKLCWQKMLKVNLELLKFNAKLIQMKLWK